MEGSGELPIIISVICISHCSVTFLRALFLKPSTLLMDCSRIPLNSDQIRFIWLTDKFNVPEKTLSLHSNWKVNIVLLSDGVSTRGENWEWVGCRIKPKRSKHRPSASIPLPPPTNLEIAQAAPPVGIHPTPLPCLHDTDSKTRQVKGRYRDNEQKTLQGFWRRQLAGVDLVSARFFVEKGFFNVETQAVLVQGLGISGFVTHYEPGIIWLIKQTGQSQMDWSNGSS